MPLGGGVLCSFSLLLFSEPVESSDCVTTQTRFPQIFYPIITAGVLIPKKYSISDGQGVSSQSHSISFLIQL